MQYSRLVLCLFIISILSSCNENKSRADEAAIVYGNSAAKGFNETDSDPKAIAIADEVMEAMGGRQAWDETRYLMWNFFGSRRHIWDKSNGDLVIQGIQDTFDILMNLEAITGTVNYRGVTLTEQDSLKKYLDKGKSMWINDAYWVFMPYKLKDSGVTLKYVHKDTTTNGRSADVLSLTFDQVGDTPNNMYHVYVDDSTRLVSQWDFYNSTKDTVARFTTPWTDYTQFDRVLLSNSRGGDYIITEISASDTLSKFFQ